MSDPNGGHFTSTTAATTSGRVRGYAVYASGYREQMETNTLSPRGESPVRDASRKLHAMESGAIGTDSLSSYNRDNDDDHEPQVTSLKQLRVLLRQHHTPQHPCIDSTHRLHQHPPHHHHHHQQQQQSTHTGNRRRQRTTSDPNDDPATRSSVFQVRCRGAQLLLLFFVLLSVLVVFDWTVESLTAQWCGGGGGDGDHYTEELRSVRSRWSPAWLQQRTTSKEAARATRAKQVTQDTCSPSVLDVSQIQYHSSHRFYDLLQRRPTPKAPVFQNKLQVLCHAEARFTSRFGYCLPMGGRKDEPFCSRADRMELLVPGAQNSSDFCYASVLHMLLVDVYEELLAMRAAPIVTYGTLLGAVRNGSLIPYTEDADIGYVHQSSSQMELLQQKLWEKGYHMFHFLIWRVCVAPTHPLASRLFTRERGLVEDYQVPYVDLYPLQQQSDAEHWTLDGTRDDDRLLRREELLPYAQVTINGLPFDTLADPVAFLVEEYGEDYMTPYQRPPMDHKPKGFQFFHEDDEEEENEEHEELPQRGEQDEEGE